MVSPPSRRRIAVLSVGDAANTRTWSGTPHHMSMALNDAVGDIIHIGPFKSRSLQALKIYNKARYALTRQRLLPAQSQYISKQYSRTAMQRIADSGADIIFAPAASSLLANITVNVPVVYSSDATAKLMFDYYPQFKTLTRSARQEANALERSAIARADLLVYPTNWAARSAIEDYDADPSRVHVLAYGPNFSELPSRDEALRARPGGAFNLIFVGVNWQIKGGQIAVDTLKALRDMGVDAMLTIVGCTPPEPFDGEHIKVIPFLDKNDPKQRRELSELYLQSDLLILPTRCECYGIVFCEAGAHGLPCVTTATGGVPDVVRDGINGFTLPLDADGQDYAELIFRLFSDQDALTDLRRTSRDEYESRLNWTIWGEKLASLVKAL